VADPNWLLGVGLQRGWNSALDAVFYADNIYNNKTFNGKPPMLEEPIEGPIEWSKHLDNLMNLMAKLGNNARESKLSEEMDTGMLDSRGPVVVQISRVLREAPVPQYLPPVAPWGRYKEYQFQVNSNYKGRNLFDNPHPLATRELALFHRNEKYVEEGDCIKRSVNRPMAAMLTWPKRFECSAFWCKMSMKLREIDGKTPMGHETLKNDTPASVLSPTFLQENVTPQKEEIPKLNPDEVQRVARRKSVRLREKVLEAAMTGPSPIGVNHNRNALDSLIFQSTGKEKSARETSENSLLPASSPKLPTVVERSLSGGSDIGGVSPIVNISPMRPSGGLFPSSDHSMIRTPSQEGYQAMTQVAKGMTIAIDDDTKKMMHQLHLSRIKLEKESFQAKLVVAKSDITKVQAEQEAVQARMVFAKTEYDRIANLLQMYTDAEAKLLSEES